jgi:recombination protein RecA
MGVVEKSGAWFSFNGERIGQGRENAKTYLDQHPQLMDKLEAMILTKHNIKRGAAAAAAEEPAAAGKRGDALAPDGKPVVKIPAPAAAAKNGTAAPDDKRPAGKPAN